MSQVTGIVQEINNFGRGKGSNVMVNGNKYGAFDPVKAGIDEASLCIGDEITFEAFEKNGYNNIKGSLTKTGGTGTPPPAPSGSSKGGKSAFPVPQLDRERMFLRQNALRHATATVNAHFPAEATMEVNERADMTVDIACIYEHYSSGDDITEAAELAEAELARTAA